MKKTKIIRITTVPQSLWKLLEGQLKFMQTYFEVIAVSSPGEKLDIVAEREGIKVVPIKITRKITPLKDIISIYALYKLFKAEKPTIVHTHTPKAGFVGMVAAKLAGVEHRLHTIAGLPVEVATGIKKYILLKVEKLTYRCATLILPNSMGMQDFILSHKLANSAKLKIIANGSSNGIDTEHFKRTKEIEGKAKLIRTELGIGNCYVFGFIGRLVKDKGIEELISAFAQINIKYPNTRLLLLGKYEEDLDPLSKETHLALESNPNIHFLGYKLDVRPYFCAMDCFLFPSYREGLPNVLLQAGALELPIIATSIAGNEDIIDSDINGILIPSKSKKELELAMIKILDSLKFSQEISRKIRTKIEGKYKREVIWNALLEKYIDLLESSKT